MGDQLNAVPHVPASLQEQGLWTATVREAQECVELFLKGALRLVAVEPARTHDVAEMLRREVNRFPEWFRAAVDRLATISTEMAGDRGLAFYGDVRQELGPQESRAGICAANDRRQHLASPPVTVAWRGAR